MVVNSLTMWRPFLAQVYDSCAVGYTRKQLVTRFGSVCKPEPSLQEARLMRGVGIYAAVLALATVAGCGDDPTPPPGPDAGTISLVFAPTAPQAAGLALEQARLKIEAVSVIGDLTPDSRTMLGETEIDMLGPPQSYVFDQAPQGLYS